MMIKCKNCNFPLTKGKPTKELKKVLEEIKSIDCPNCKQSNLASEVIVRCKCVHCSTIVESDASDSFGIDKTGKPYYVCEECYNGPEFKKMFDAGIERLKTEEGRKEFINACMKEDV